MANITTTSTTSFPSGLDTRTTVTDDPAGTEIVASHHNGPAAAIIAVETELGTDPAGSAADLKTRLAVALNDDGTVKSTVNQAGTGASITYSSGVFTYAFSSDAAQFSQNVGMSASVSGNALTVNIMAGDGDTPVSTNAPLIPFRDTTITKGNYNVRSVLVSTSVTLPAGGTLSFVNNEVGRLYLYGIDNSGTVEAALARKAVFDEGQLHTTVAIGTGSNLDTYLYSTTARSNVPVRLLGYLEITGGSTAGNWSNAPSRLQLSGYGVHRTGDVVATFVTTSSAHQTGSRTIPKDDTPPQSNEGDCYFRLPVSFSSAINRVTYEGTVQVTNGAAGVYMVAALFRPQITDAFCTTVMHMSSTENRTIPIIFHTITGVVNSTTITLRLGGDNAGTTALNDDGTVGTRIHGGVCYSTLAVTEIFA